MQKNKRVALALIALCVLAAGIAASYIALRPQTTGGGKNIEVLIVKSQDESRTVKIQTNAEYLRQALEEQDLIQGEESQYGLFVKTVDGRTADDSKQEWWCFTKNGEQITTGVDVTPISDGEHYEITLNTGY